MCLWIRVNDFIFGEILMQKIAIQELLEREYLKVNTPHPFSEGILLSNIESILGEYYFMSQYFPFIQSCAHTSIVKSCLVNRVPIPKNIEKTSVVGAFLSWDELGGHHKISKYGISALPSILDSNGFHSNILKKDITEKLNLSLPDRFSEETGEYLERLLERLGSNCIHERIANMVAFEINASYMITALYDSLKSLFKKEAQLLTYFEIHVGGDDPAEPYHMDMTSRLVDDSLNDLHSLNDFLDKFNSACLFHSKWMRSIKSNLKNNVA